MTLEQIIRRPFSDETVADIQDAVIQDVLTRPQYFLDRYVEHFASQGGRYVNSDLMKEMFPVYRASRESRGRYNLAVHNSAAALAAMQYRQLVASYRPGDANTAVFLTGMPGAGKSTFFQQGGGLGANVWLVFEGQLARPQTTLPKIEAALGAGLRVEISVFHPLPEDALRNTFKRFREIGRGAGIEALAQIQGHLPQGLDAVRRLHGDNVGLRVYDVRDRGKTVIHDGWSALNVLRSEEGYDEIKHRLNNELDRCYRAGDIDDACLQQAGGRPPQLSGLATARTGRDGAPVQGRGGAGEVRQAPVVGPEDPTPGGRPGGRDR